MKLINVPSQAQISSSALYILIHLQVIFLNVKDQVSFIIHQYSTLEAGLAGTRAQSCDRCGSGTLYPGQVLGGSLKLLSPAFRRSHFRRQVPVRPQRRERSQQRKVELCARNCPVILPKFRLPRKFGDLLHVRHGTDGFTSPPKEGVLRIFIGL